MPLEKRKAQFRATFILSLITAILIGALSLAAWLVISDYKEQSLRLIKETKIQEQEKYEKIVQDRTNNVLTLLQNAKDNAEATLRHDIRERVNEAYSALHGLYEGMKGKHSEKDIREACKAMLRDVRWHNGAGFYFIDSLDGEVVLLPDNPKVEGLNILHEGKPVQKRLISKIRDTAIRSGAGYVEYLASKDHSKKFLSRKLAYIRTFEPFGWVVGTGAFPADAMQDVQEKMLESLSKINFDKGVDEYVFVIDLSKEDDAHMGQLRLTRNSVVAQGQMIPHGFTDSKGFALLDEALDEIRKDGESFVKYNIKKPSTGMTEDRISFFKLFKDWNWLVGTGFYLDGIRETYQAKVEQIQDETDRKVFYAIISLGCLLFIAIGAIVMVAIQRGRVVDKRHKIVQQLLDSQRHIVFLTNGKDLIACNKHLLRTLGFPSLEAFREEHDCICELFHGGEGFLPNEKGVWIDEVSKAEANREVAKAVVYDHAAEDRRIFMVKIGDEIMEGSYVAVSLTDITESERNKNELDRYIKIVDEYVQTSSTDVHGAITYVSKALTEATGYSEEELLGQNHRVLRHRDMPHELFKEMWDTIISGRTWQGEVKNRTKDGGESWTQSYISPVHNELGEHVGYTAIRHDITDKKRIEALTITDVMTELPNRRFFNMTCQRELNRAKRHGHNLAFLMLDVDRFKQYNDTYGHQAGDEALIAVGRVMKESFRRADEYCFRLGGEEFGVLLCDINPFEAHRLAEILRKAIEDIGIEHVDNPPSQVLTASIGLVVTPVNVHTTQDLLMASADKALYEAKESGRNMIVMIEKELGDKE